MDGGQVKDSEPNKTQTQSNSPRLHMYKIIVDKAKQRIIRHIVWRTYTLERDQAVMVTMTDTRQELFSHRQPSISASQPKLNRPGHTPHLPDAHLMLTDTSQQG